MFSVLLEAGRPAARFFVMEQWGRPIAGEPFDRPFVKLRRDLRTGKGAEGQR